MIDLNFNEEPVLRITRTFEELQELDHDLDMHESSLGAAFPNEVDHDELLDDPESVVRIQEEVEKWLGCVVEKLDSSDTISLADLIRPRDDDVEKIVTELNYNGGLDDSWGDVMDVLMVGIQEYE